MLEPKIRQLNPRHSCSTAQVMFWIERKFDSSLLIRDSNGGLELQLE